MDPAVLEKEDHHPLPNRYPERGLLGNMGATCQLPLPSTTADGPSKRNYGTVGITCDKFCS